MDILYRKIADIVENEAACLEEFLTLLINQQKYLVDNDVESLRDGVARQQEIISRIKALEKSRSSLVAKYSDSNNLDPEDVTISSLARRADGAIADKLLELQNSLLSLHQKIEKAKRKNEFLIEHSMKYIESTIKLIAEKSVPVNNYAPHDKQESMILSRIV